MTKNHKQKKVTSISLKFKTPQCVNLYRKVICPDQWSLILSQTLQTLRIKTQKEDLFFKKTELEEGKNTRVKYHYKKQDSAKQLKW